MGNSLAEERDVGYWIIDVGLSRQVLCSVFLIPASLFLFLVACNNESDRVSEMTDSPPPNEHSQDPHQWLEGVEDEKALSWVREQNARTLSELQADDHYAEYEATALEVLTSKERIPYGRIRDGVVYNFWQDDVHVRGLWRRTPVDSYATENPEWETVLDIDQLAKDETRTGSSKEPTVFGTM